MNKNNKRKKNVPNNILLALLVAFAITFAYIYIFFKINIFTKTIITLASFLAMFLFCKYATDRHIEILDITISKLSILSRKNIKSIKKYVQENTFLILLFISMYILDLSLRIAYYDSIKFIDIYSFVPNTFSIIWLIFLLAILKYFNKIIGKIIYIISYLFSLIMFFVHAIYYSYFKLFFDYSVLQVAGEGFSYFDTIFQHLKLWIVLIALISIILFIWGLKKLNKKRSTNYKMFITITIICLFIHTVLPVFLGKSSSIDWDDWRNPRTVYSTFNDNNKSMLVAGMFEYNIRNFYINFLRNNKDLVPDEDQLLIDNFDNITVATKNSYTGIFKGKNLIIVQFEGLESFLIDKNVMPTTYNLMNNSLNFINHYSFTSGGGSTFNSEFMVNVGYSTAYNYNLNAYSFSKNCYSYSLPNLFSNYGYKTNTYHMNSQEYYSRGVNYKSFGYDSYNGLKDLGTYNDNSFWLDSELVNNEIFNNLIFNDEGLSLSYFIAYSTHMPFNSNKGVCSLLTEEDNLTELECLKLQAKETDNFMASIISNLEEHNMLKNTVIVAFSDHYLYTLEDKTILDKYKVTNNNLINKTPFFIYSNGKLKKTIKTVNSQLDILPTILNLFGIEYYPNYYLGYDIFSKDYPGIVYFKDGSWYNGSTYVENGEIQTGKKLLDNNIAFINQFVKRKMTLNDAVLKSDYFRILEDK